MDNFNDIFTATAPSNGKLNTKKIVLISVICAVLVACALVGGIFIGVGMYGVSQSGKDMIESMPEMVKVYQYIKDYYYLDISWEEFQVMVADGMLRSLDAFSGLSLKEGVSEAVPAVGIQVMPTEYNEYVVSHVAKGSPAYDKGLRRGDEITHVNGNRLRGANRSKYFELMEDKTGDGFAFTVERTENGAIVTKEFEPAQKQLLTNLTDVEYENIDAKTGLIKFYTFGTAHTVADFARAVDEFIANGNQNLILDLRDNGGGSVDTLQRIAPFLIKDASGASNNLFLMKLKYKEGTEIDFNSKAEEISFTRKDGSEGSIRADYIGNKVQNFKLAVLTNGNSASASEALMGAIDYFGTGVQIGTKTYGKGVAQAVLDFNTVYEVYITAANYWIKDKTNSLISIHGKGITPSEDFTVAGDKPMGSWKEEKAVQRAFDYFDGR